VFLLGRECVVLLSVHLSFINELVAPGRNINPPKLNYTVQQDAEV
jgi:hypothetical protein